MNLICNSDNICVDAFSVGENGKCRSTLECKAGYECYLSACTKPVYHFLSGPGVVWGSDCDPSSGETGCRCNYGTRTYQYLKEYSVTYSESCNGIGDDLEKCLTTNGCSALNTGAESCMRKYCMSIYNNLIDKCFFC
jgi:hypothetical protein